MDITADILIVDDEEDILLTLEYFLSPHFQKLTLEPNPRKIPEHLRKHRYDLILLDMNFGKGETGGSEGLAWLDKIVAQQPTASVIMMTAYADVKVAVEAVKRGAVDFIEKPWRNEKLLATLLAAYKLSQSRKQVKKLERHQQVLTHEFDRQAGTIIGSAPAMQRVFDIIDKVAKTDANILILGENGTGKELVARAIHQRSKRAEDVFVSVDLGAVSSTLFESELFGHKKGAFTDAKEDRDGQFQVASGGSLFLDEIGNLSMPLQSKLLSALQNRVIRKLGTNESIPIDIRLICATNMPLYEMAEKQEFRIDLLYRINTVEISLPPLRERKEDIPALLDHFLDIYTRKYQKPPLEVGADTIERLQLYPWHGNVRELRHAVERAVILSEGKNLELSDFLLKEKPVTEAESLQFESYNLAELEKWAIDQALHKYQGNITKAAEELGLTRAALYRRMAKYEM